MKLITLGAAGRVTGSLHLLEVGDHRILLDCGMIQGGRKQQELNREPFPFDPARIDAVVLSHAHIDHSGRIPLLINGGFAGPVYAHTATRALCDIMLKDAGYIQEHDAERENRRRERKGLPRVEPLYTADQAVDGMRQFKSLPYDRKFRVLPNVIVRFRDAGHILGSCVVELWLTEGDDQRKVVFSGDLGHEGAPILRDPTVLHDADLVLMESTYGDRDHRSWEETAAEVLDVAAETRNAKGNILIPAFAVGRSQLLLYWMVQNYADNGFADWRIFLDSPMAIRATHVYGSNQKLFDAAAREAWGGKPMESLLPNLTFSRTAAQSMQINEIRSGAIIIAGSGMCTGGRIVHHLRRNLWRKECHVVIVGYQAGGTTGRQIVDGAKRIRLFGETINVAATIHTIGGLSAHAGRREMMDWYDQYHGRPPVVLVHGEPRAQEALQRDLRDEFAAPVHIAAPGDTFDLAKPIPFET
jgi:metallo-beta-lactamase family protein